MQRVLAGLLIAGLACVAVDALFWRGHSPETWALTCLCFWSSFLIARGRSPFSAWELRNVTWATASLVSFMFLLLDGDLRSWADVYYFCGDDMRYCTADYRWNVRGWRKAVALWNFMLATAMGLQRLFIVLGLGGLLRGEETLTQESFISIAWRLIPYWLNNWEQQWGAECSSMIFELPHFALELLVVLPCVQILCARLKVLAHPPAVAEDGAGADDAPWAPDVLRYRWERRAGERRLVARLKHNLRPMTVVLFVCCLASMNAMVIPRLLELSVVQDERSGHLLGVERELQAVSTGKPAGPALPAAFGLGAAHERAAGEDADAAAAADGARALDPVRARPAAGLAPPGAPGAWSVARDHTAAARRSAPAAFPPRRHAPSPLDPGARARLGVWITLFQPLLPLHWLESLQLLDEAVVRGLDPVIVSALQRWRATRAPRRVVSVWNGLLASGAGEEDVEDTQGGSTSNSSAPRPGEDAGWSVAVLALRELNLTETLFLAARAGGLDAAAAPLRLRAERVDDDDDARSERLTSRSKTSMTDTTSQEESLRARVAWLRERQASYWSKLRPESAVPPTSAAATPLRMGPLYRSLHKHARELRRMTHPEHVRLFPLLELALAIMRLSCERFFTLLPVWVAYLAFRDPPRAARRVVVGVARTAAAFQRAVLLAFPAVCWAYQAGMVFSTFVSFVFWTGPLRALAAALRERATSVRPAGWRPASAEDIERMGGNCAVCWGELAGAAVDEGGSSVLSDACPADSGPCTEHHEQSAPLRRRAVGGPRPSAGASPAASESSLRTARSEAAPAESWHSAREEVSSAAASEVDSGATREADRERPGRMGPAMSLQCGHAYHSRCILQWLQQCFSQGRMPTCPMCQASIQLEVHYRWPFGRRLDEAASDPDGDEDDDAVEGLEREGRVIPGLRALTLRLRDDFQNRFEPFPDVPPEQEIPFRA
ncbi:hypothetical protein QBZ16_003438 [Prototheca wickerhamii]|uniref:RING-type domain-containing protein n=1 Tax=Prototheca wickerhamii TaxID=3111 RepID=A0AAD9IJ91_PROWI|nr:hypothetical protein QBZ16_003438 [Prototheca wickerhamii]